jgi:hypothetical protein
MHVRAFHRRGPGQHSRKSTRGRANRRVRWIEAADPNASRAPIGRKDVIAIDNNFDEPAGRASISTSGALFRVIDAA